MYPRHDMLRWPIAATGGRDLVSRRIFFYAFSKTRRVAATLIEYTSVDLQMYVRKYTREFDKIIIMEIYI